MAQKQNILWGIGLVAGFACMAAIACIITMKAQQRFSGNVPLHDLGSRNEVAAERLLYGNKDQWLILAGSSAASFMPPPTMMPVDAYTLAMQGSGGMSGLEIILCSGARPKVVLLEADLLFRDIDKSFVADMCDPVAMALRRQIPALRYGYNLVNLTKIRFTPLPPPDMERPKMTMEEWERKRRPMVERMVGRMQANMVKELPEMRRERQQHTLARLKQDIELLKERGTEVVFYATPLSPDVATLPRYVEWRELLRQHFPEQRILAPEGQYYLSDGIHMVPYSALRYYHDLREQVAGMR